MSTKYTVQSFDTNTNEFADVAVRSDKNAALAVAHKIAIDTKATTRVLTGKGTEVGNFEAPKAGKRVRRSLVWAKPYTRLDVRATEAGQAGWEAAYFRPRRDAVTLRRPIVLDEETGRMGFEYAIARLDGTILASGIPTTRATSRYMANVTKAADLNV